MQHQHLPFCLGFRVVLGDNCSQAAQMTLDPGQIEGGSDNRHRRADQWLLIVNGEGLDIVEGERAEFREGTLLLVQRDYTHEIRNTGSEPLRTLNVYFPPAYTTEGNELAGGQE